MLQSRRLATSQLVGANSWGATAVTSRLVSSPLSAVKAADAARLKPPSRLAVSGFSSSVLTLCPPALWLSTYSASPRGTAGSPPRYCVAPVSLRPTDRGGLRLNDRQILPSYYYFSMSSGGTAAAAVNGPAPVATETSFAAYVTGTSRCSFARGLNHTQSSKWLTNKRRNDVNTTKAVPGAASALLNDTYSAQWISFEWSETLISDVSVCYHLFVYNTKHNTWVLWS